ncbi:MAG TPA: hypothetical protein ENG61_02090, partial [Candidatus Korarchaeota archaeon]|nr:hypothetical protein [Candidatus Korarchaeota archaeon]
MYRSKVKEPASLAQARTFIATPCWLDRRCAKHSGNGGKMFKPSIRLVGKVLRAIVVCNGDSITSVSKLTDITYSHTLKVLRWLAEKEIIEMR